MREREVCFTVKEKEVKAKATATATATVVEGNKNVEEQQRLQLTTQIVLKYIPPPS